MFDNLNGLEIMYLVCAGIGGGIFLLRLVLQIVGFDHGGVGDTDVAVGDAGVDVDMDMNTDSAHADSDAGFKFLTVHGITSFFMMFGLVGFALYRQSGVGTFLSVLGALAAGLVTVWIIGKMFGSLSKLHSSGTLNTVSAIGAEGTVYLTIPEGGTGRVQVTFKNRMRELDAVSQSGASIQTGEPVRVVWVNGDVLVVEKTRKAK